MAAKIGLATFSVFLAGAYRISILSLYKTHTMIIIENESTIKENYDLTIFMNGQVVGIENGRCL